MGFSRTAALGYLRRAHEQNRLAHAYLISGSQGSGKQLLAAELASLVNGTKATDVFSSKAREQNWNIQHAYRLAQAFQRLLRLIRDQIKGDTDEALRSEEARYRNSTDGVWLEEREEYYKALTESLYLQRRAGLIETLFAWW